MISRTAHLFSDGLRAQALDHFGILPVGLVTHEGFCSHVFEGHAGGERVVLKLSHSSRVSREALASELAFAGHLRDAGVPVCPPLVKPGELLALPDGEGGQWFAYLYGWVPGEPYDEAPRRAEDFEAAGRALGQLHRASLDFDHACHTARPSFLDRDFLDFERILPAEEVSTREVFRQIVAELRALDLGDEAYGMTHGDAHDGNLLRAAGCSGASPPSAPQAWIIDLDDVEPGYFLNDVAVFVDSVCEPGEGMDAARVDEVFRALLRGYREFMDVPAEWWGHLPKFMRFRWIMDHCVFQQMRGHRVDSDPKLKGIRDRRIEMYRRGFPEHAFLYGFDYVGAARRV